MRLSFFPYTLKNRGALIRVQFDDGCMGYADCHPWESLGDLCLEEQLARLDQGETTPLTAQSLQFARMDAEARNAGVSLFEGLEVPNSHLLLLDVYQTANAPLVKVKLGKNLDAETETLKTRLHHCRARLDFNCQMTQSRFEKFLQDIESVRDQIEFYEDPFPYERDAWAHMQKKYGIALACDWHSERAIGHLESAAYLVVKPAVQIESDFHGEQKIVVTSYLDHPIGQLGAAYVAAQMKKRLQVVECGLLSHQVYPENAFSSFLPKEGGVFKAPPGTGFGFDDLLTKLDFVPL